MNQQQLTFEWDQNKSPESQDAADGSACGGPICEVPDLEELAPPRCDSAIGSSPPSAETGGAACENPPVPRPLPEAVVHGVFGWSTDGPIVPDEKDVSALTIEHSFDLKALLIELSLVEDALRTGCDPHTGRPSRTPEAALRVQEGCKVEENRLKRAYSDALAAYAEGFGPDAADALDRWVRAVVAGPLVDAAAYEPTHPWHYLAAGDGAAPTPVHEIPSDDEAGAFLEADLPKNHKKRLERIRELLDQEGERLAEDKQRYLGVVERGVEALSRYDREIAYTNDEIAVASTLALKYRHISLGLGRVAWLEDQVAGAARGKLFTEKS